MKNNTILSISTTLMQVARVAIALLAGFIVLFFIASLLNYPFDLSEFLHSISAEDSNLSQTLYTLEANTIWISTFVVLQQLLILIAWFQILGYGRDIINNIKSIKTFAKDNVKAFSKVSRLAIFLLVIQVISFNPDQISISIAFNYVVFAFTAIILTQVFKEGQKLLEENELTV